MKAQVLRRTRPGLHTCARGGALGIDRAGMVGYHAEFRALNDLAVERFGNTYVEPRVFDEWLKNDVLGYVRQIKPDKENNIIKHTCVHCYFFTELVTFIRIN